MKHFFILLFSFLLILTACEKVEDPGFNYETIVDSSFYCNADVNGEQFNFSFHDRPTFGTEIYGDSILIKAFLNYRESEASSANIFWITIARKFRISDLDFSINNNGTPYSSGDMSHEEFNTMFNEGNNSFSYFDCSDNCTKNEGIELSFDSFHGTTFKTELLSKFVNNQEVNQFYDNSSFNITKLNWLANNAVLIEGNFNVDMYSFYGDLISVRNGNFKAFCKNITYPDVINEDLLWNK